MADTPEAQATNILEPIRKRSIDEQPSLIGAEIEKLIPKVSEAQAGLEQAKEARLVDSKLARAEESQKQTGITREEYQKGRGKLSQYEMPTFKPNQEDAMSFSQLGSLVGTLGVMLGAGGKASAKVALGSMTGMMNGWQKGRKDLYERELKTFNTEFKRIENIRKDILNDVEMSMRLRSTDAKAAEDYAEAARFKMGSGSVGEYLSRTGQLKGLMGYLNSQAKVAEAAKVTKDKYEQKIEEAARRFENQKELEGMRQESRREIAQSNQQGRREIAELRADLKGDGKDDRTKATSVDFRNYSALKRQERGWNRIETLLADKDFAERFDKLGVKKFLFEPIAGDGISAFVSRGLSSAIAKSVAEKDPQLVTFLQDIIIVRNAYYLEQSGKSVTGGEAARNFFASIQPTDSAAVLFEKAKRAKQEIATERTELEGGLRGLSRQKSEQTTKPIPTAEDIAYAKANPETEKMFIQQFGRKP